MADAYSDTPDRMNLYKDLDEHIKVSRKIDSSIQKKKESKGEPASIYGNVYDGDKKSAFEKFMDFLLMRNSKKKNDDYVDMDYQTGKASTEQVKKTVVKEMAELDEEEELIKNAEAETSRKKSRSVWSLMGGLFGKKKKQETYDEYYVEGEFEKEYKVLDEQDKLLHEEEKRVVKKKRGLIWRLMASLDLVSKPKDENISQEKVQAMIKPAKSDDVSKEDMRFVSEFSLDLLRKLSPAQLERVKDMEDFEKFKVILKKHNLIK